MNADPLYRLQQCIDALEFSLASTFDDVVHDLRLQFETQVEQAKTFGKAQADAIVHSAEIICELEETKEFLELSRSEAEAATKRARQLGAFGDILEHSLNEIYIFEAENLRFVHVNLGARKNIGYSMDELRELTPLDLKPNHTQSTFAELLAPLQNETSHQVDFTTVHRRKNGTEYPVQVHLEASLLNDNRVFAAIILDITERQRIEKELEESRNRALDADRMKTEFLANMSHEIRTPMTAILGYSDLLNEPKVTDDEKTIAIQTIQRNGCHLLELINDILDLSKVESGKFEVEKQRVNFGRILQDVIDLHADRARAQCNSLQIVTNGDIPQFIHSDSTRLKQALVNLVGNAIKFTRNGVVKLVAECDWQNEQMKIQVVDSGIGMTPEQMNRIFRPFSQADSSTTRKFGGTGLGLAITKKIAQLLGGAVAVESAFESGSTFTLSIDTGAISGEQISSAESKPEGLDRKSNGHVSLDKINGRVLLIEDGVDNQRLITFILKKAGAEVTVVENGKLGVEVAMAALSSFEPFGVVLMDMQMPVMDGYTAATNLRDNGYAGQIIALTAHAMKGDIDKCLDSGCDAYLSKPIDRKIFVSEVAARMGKPSVKANTIDEVARS